AADAQHTAEQTGEHPDEEQRPQTRWAGTTRVVRRGCHAAGYVCTIVRARRFRSPMSAPTGDFPRFSPTELDRRRRALAEVMERAGVDDLLLYGHNRTGTAVQWISEWPVTQEAALLFRPGETDVLLVQ